jgi:hypothetical protein
MSTSPVNLNAASANYLLANNAASTQLVDVSTLSAQTKTARNVSVQNEARISARQTAQGKSRGADRSSLVANASTQRSTSNRSERRSASSANPIKTSATQTRKRDVFTAQDPKSPVVISYNSKAGNLQSTQEVTVTGGNTSTRTSQTAQTPVVAPTTTAPTNTTPQAADATNTTGTTATPQTPTSGGTSSGTEATFTSAKQMLASFDGLLKQVLGSHYKEPATHADRIKLAAEAAASLKGATLNQFLAQAEALGKDFGLNFGLSKSTSAGKQALNHGTAASLDKDHAEVYSTLAKEWGGSSSTTAAAGSEGNGGSTAANDPSATTGGTDTTTTAASAAEIKAQSVADLLTKTVYKQTAEQTGAMVTSWATSNGTDISKAELDAANPALAAQWDVFAKGKTSVSVSELSSVLIRYSGQPATTSTPATTPTTTPNGTTTTPDDSTPSAGESVMPTPADKSNVG